MDSYTNSSAEWWIWVNLCDLTPYTLNSAYQALILFSCFSSDCLSEWMFRNLQINENLCSYCLHPILVFKAYLGNDERKFFDRIPIFCKLSLILKLIHSIEKSITLFRKRALDSVYLNETPLITDFIRLGTIIFLQNWVQEDSFSNTRHTVLSF